MLLYNISIKKIFFILPVFLFVSIALAYSDNRNHNDFRYYNEFTNLHEIDRVTRLANKIERRQATIRLRELKRILAKRKKGEEPLLRDFKFVIDSKILSASDLKLSIKDLNIQIAETEKNKNDLDSELNCMGDVIMRGIAGKEALRMVEDLQVGDDMKEGFRNGVMLRGSISVGNAIGGIIERYIEMLFQGTIGKAEEFIRFIYRELFHDSHRPFTIGEIAYWKKLISSDLRDIEIMMKNAEKNDSRGKAEILREYETGNLGNESTVNLWQDFIEDLALTCQELAEEVEMRKGYYEKESGFGITNSANRLQSKLLKARNWLLKVKTLKEFVNTPEAKSIIPAMKKSIENYFDILAEQIKPLNSTKKDLKLSVGSSSRKNRWDRDGDAYFEDDPYPGFMR